MIVYIIQLPFELLAQRPVQLLLEPEPNWQVHNVIELEFELNADETTQLL